MFWLKDRAVLFCVDANPRIGTRHVRRCLALSQSLAKYGFESHWLTPELPASLYRRIADSATSHKTFAAQDLNEFCWRASIEDKAKELHLGWTVYDGPRFDLNPITGNDGKSIRFRQFDSGCEGAELCQNGRLKTVLDQPRYSIAEARRKRDPEFRREVRRIVWHWSDTAMTAVRERVLQSLLRRKRIYSIDILVDHANASFDDAVDALQQHGHCVRVHRSADRWLPQFAQADLAIVDNGTWLPDLSVQHVPTILLNENVAADIASTLAEQNALLLLELADSPKQLHKRLVGFMSDPDARQLCCQRTYEFFDGKGVQRIARAMAAETFRFRSCEISDCQLLFDWRNDPESRAVSFDSSRVELDEYFAWLRRQIGSPSSRILIIEDQHQRSVGQFRVEFDASFENAELNFEVAPSLRGMGIGTALLERACRFLDQRHPGVTVFADIRAKNQVSQTAFRKAGFESESTFSKRGRVAVRYAWQQLRGLSSTTTANKIGYRKAS